MSRTLEITRDGAPTIVIERPGERTIVLERGGTTAGAGQGHAVEHDATLAGNGTPTLPLSVADGGVSLAKLATDVLNDHALRDTKIGTKEPREPTHVGPDETTLRLYEKYILVDAAGTQLTSNAKNGLYVVRGLPLSFSADDHAGRIAAGTSRQMDASGGAGSYTLPLATETERGGGTSATLMQARAAAGIVPHLWTNERLREFEQHNLPLISELDILDPSAHQRRAISGELADHLIVNKVPGWARTHHGINTLLAAVDAAVGNAAWQTPGPAGGASAFSDLTGMIAGTQIPDDTITHRMMGNNSVHSEQLQTGSVTGAKITNGSVSEDKLAQAVIDQLGGTNTPGTDPISFTTESIGDLLVTSGVNVTEWTLDRALRSDGLYFLVVHDNDGADKSVFLNKLFFGAAFIDEVADVAALPTGTDSSWRNVGTNPTTGIGGHQGTNVNLWHEADDTTLYVNNSRSGSTNYEMYEVTLAGIVMGVTGTTAAEVTVDTTNFTQNLTGDDTVQAALETIDQFSMYQGAWRQTAWPAGVIVTRNGIAYMSLVNGNSQIPTPASTQWSGQPEGFIYRGHAPVLATNYNYGQVVVDPDTDIHYYFTSTISASVARADIATHANFHALSAAVATDDSTLSGSGTTADVLKVADGGIDHAQLAPNSVGVQNMQTNSIHADYNWLRSCHASRPRAYGRLRTSQEVDTPQLAGAAVTHHKLTSEQECCTGHGQPRRRRAGADG